MLRPLRNLRPQLLTLRRRAILLTAASCALAAGIPATSALAASVSGLGQVAMEQREAAVMGLEATGSTAGVDDARAAAPLFFPAKIRDNPTKLHYGVAVVDVDGDGKLEFVVCGFNGPNLVLKYDGTQLVDLALSDPRIAPLQDPLGQAIGIAAADIDGDGQEEIYFLNTNDAYSGMKRYRDKLFKRGPDGVWRDLLEDDDNAAARNPFAGRSVAVVDRRGDGRYSFYVSNYASLASPPFGSGSSAPRVVGAVKLVEMDEAASREKGKLILKDAAAEAGVAAFTGGRGVTAGVGIARTLLSPGSASMDLLAVNERGANFLYRNDGKGGFKDVAGEAGVSDKHDHGRGVALLDVDNSGRPSLTWGNWEGPHRLLVRSAPSSSDADSDTPRYRDIAPPEMAEPTPIRTVLAADFDNDGEVEVFHNNIAYSGLGDQPNKLFKKKSRDGEEGGAGATSAEWVKLPDSALGASLEPDGYGTGGAYADIDDDGSLELLLSHGESREQPLSFFRVSEEAKKRPVLQVLPLTQHGAPARGTLVVAHWRKSGKKQAHVSDAGSGYLCQMTPVVHFGLGEDELEKLKITWPDGTQSTIAASSGYLKPNHRLVVSHPSSIAATTTAPSTQTLRLK